MSTPRKKPPTKRHGPVASRTPSAPVTRKAILTEVRELILTARHQVAQAVNARLTILHWQIGIASIGKSSSRSGLTTALRLSRRCRSNWKRSSDEDSDAGISSA